MEAKEVHNVKSAREIIAERELKHIKVGVFDIDGVMRGKYMAKDKFLSALDNGFGFCDVVLGWDVRDKLYDNVNFTGWHTGYPDASVRIIPDSCRELPLENDGLMFLAEFVGDAEAICPRGVLRRVIKQAKALGMQIEVGFEYEFFVFNETPESIRAKRYQGLTPMAPAEFGYSVIRNTVEAKSYLDLLELCEQMDIPLEGLHEETGPGVMEAAIAHDDALAAADKAALFKTFTKVAMQKEGKMATFMARWSTEHPGQSGHIHLSVRDLKGRSMFYDEHKPDNISDTMRHFYAGQQMLMPEMLAMIAPTVNAYRRLVPGFWAPTEASVGVDNRTCAIRLIPGSEHSQRIEYRIGAADANPYIILAAVIASGLWGVENRVEPEPLVEGSAYEHRFPEHLQLPNTLWDAAQRLKHSSIARHYFGDAFVDHFSATREW